MLEISNLAKNFGGLRAIDDVTLTVPSEGISALIGPNGAGKTTLFSLISGFIDPDQGKVTFAGHDISGWPAHRVSQLGLVRTFQLVRPFAGLSVLDNIAIGAHRHERSRAAARAQAREVADFVGMGTSIDQPAGTLTVSGRKRLELARALATKPRMLLLDEVMAGLNPTEIDEILAVLRVISSSGTTIFLIEHVMRAVMTLADRIWVLNNGGLIAQGSPEEIASNDHVIEAYLGHGAAALVTEGSESEGSADA